MQNHLAAIRKHTGPIFRDPEHILLTTTDNTAVQKKFSRFTSDTVRDVLIQNNTSSKCYITWGTSVVTATTNHTILPGYSHLSLESVCFTYFSVIREVDGNNVVVHITGIG